MQAIRVLAKQKQQQVKKFVALLLGESVSSFAVYFPPKIILKSKVKEVRLRLRRGEIALVVLWHVSSIPLHRYLFFEHVVARAQDNQRSLSAA
mgnify:CR=1 FL=1